MKPTRLWVCLLITVLIGPGTVRAINTCYDYDSGWYCCDGGSVATTGGLSKYSDTICAGGKVTPPTISPPTFNSGVQCNSHQRRDCSAWTDTAGVSFSPSTWWGSTPPSSFPNCGVYSYSAYGKGVSSGVCPDLGPF